MIQFKLCINQFTILITRSILLKSDFINVLEIDEENNMMFDDNNKYFNGNDHYGAIGAVEGSDSFIPRGNNIPGHDTNKEIEEPPTTPIIEPQRK